MTDVPDDDLDGPPRDIEAAFLGAVVEVDLAGWAHGGLPRHPEGLVSLTYAPPVHEERNRRGDVTRHAQPAHVRLSGPLGGVRLVDSDDLVAEALRLLDAAATLDAIKAAYPPRQTTQEELTAP